MSSIPFRARMCAVRYALAVLLVSIFAPPALVLLFATPFWHRAALRRLTRRNGYNPLVAAALANRGRGVV